MRKNWIILPFLLIISFTYYLYLQRLHPLTGEEFMLLLQGERVLNGDLPYKDFFQFLTPGSIYLSALLFKIFGVKLSVIKIFIPLAGCTIVLLTYLLSARIIRSRLIGILPAIFVLYYSIPFAPLFYHHWNAELPLLLAILFGLRALSTSNLLYIFLYGLTSGIAFLFLQHKGILIFLASIAFLIIDSIKNKDKMLKPAFITSIGFFIPLFSYILYLYLNGAHKEFLYDCFLWVKDNYAPFNSLPEFLYFEKRTFQYYLTTSALLPAIIKTRNLFFVGYLPLFVFLAGIIDLIRNFKREILFLYLTSLFLFLSVLSRPDFINILYISQPLFVLLIYYLYEFLKTECRPKRFIGIFLVTLLILNALYGLLSSVREASHYKYPLYTTRGVIYFKSVEDAKDYSEVLNYIESNLKSNKVFILNFSTFFYFLSGLRNYTSYDVILPGYHTDEQLADLIEQLRVKKIEYILYDSLDLLIKQQGENSMYPEGYKRIDLKNKLNEYINNNYSMVNQIGRIKIMKAKISP